MKAKFNNFAAMMLVVVSATIAACGSLNPLSRAQTVEQKAYALYGEFVVVEEQAAVLAQSPDVSASIKKSIAQFDAAAKSSADALLDAAVAVKTIRDDLKKGKSTEEQLLIATASLQRWYDDLIPKLQRLATAIRGATK